MRSPAVTSRSLLLRDPAHFEQLLGVLEHPDPLLRAGAAVALGHIQDSRAIEPLIERLDDPIYLVARCAAQGLGAMGTLAVGSILAVLQEAESDQERSICLQALAAIRDPQAVDILCAALGYPEEQARRGAAIALGEIGDPAAVAALSASARHPDPDTQRHAGRALGKIGHPDGIQALTALLGEADWQLREVGVDSLGQIGTDAVLVPVLTALQDPVWQVRKSAVQVIRTLRNPQMVDTLLSTMSSTSSWVRYHLIEILGEIGDRRVHDLLEDLALNEGDLQTRLSAAQALALMGHERGRSILLRTMNAPNSTTRLLAAIALGNSGDPQAAALLLRPEALADPDPDTPQGAHQRERVIDALVASGQPALPELLKALGGPSPRVARVAMDTIEKLGQPAVDGLIEAVDDPDSETRDRAIELLGRIADPRAAEPLANILRNAISRPYLLRLLASSLYDPGVSTRIRAVAAIEKIPSESLDPLLVETARFDIDEAVRTGAKRALIQRGSPENILKLSQPNLSGFLHMGLVSLTFLMLICVTVGGMVAWSGVRAAAPLAGLLIGATLGFSDGFAAGKSPLRATLASTFLLLGFGLLVELLGRAPDSPAALVFPVALSGILIAGSLGLALGFQLARPALNRSGPVIQIGILYFLLPGVLGLLGAAMGGILGSLLGLWTRGSWPIAFAGAVVSMLVLVWTMRRSGQRTLIGSGGSRILLGLLGAFPISAVAATGLGPWGLTATAALLPVFVILLARRPLSLERRLGGLFVGMIAGFLGALIGLFIVGLLQ